ncbi:hypothetical protein CPAR01_00957 [Colletotrichum paranaense]|uniref:Uncharacterized protein n=1 Tax=Colletotrichum paranaense TaxID=1914294 RepID=A0ABQ9T5D4_9PEZI|nr:uncharacterized protein CPAR01_00957 [Colletotrichum paranaense]KAK1546990.1 hypothetical protein CPAR01_00957 [Colletotrichum paranaense]
MYLDLYLVPCAVNWRESESFFLYLSSPSSSSSSRLHFVSKAKTENQGPTTSSSSPVQLQLRSIRKISNRTHRPPFSPRSSICQAVRVIRTRATASKILTAGGIKRVTTPALATTETAAAAALRTRTHTSIPARECQSFLLLIILTQSSIQDLGISGSIHYSTPKSERYENDGNGGSPYTSASGYRTCSGYGKK